MARAAFGLRMGEKKRKTKQNKNINSCHTVRLTGAPFPGPLARKTRFLSEVLLCSLTTQLSTKAALGLTWGIEENLEKFTP